MIDHESHLKSVLQTQKTLSAEISELNIIISSKREQYLKLQGIAEYLTSNGIKLTENEDTSQESTEKE